MYSTRLAIYEVLYLQPHDDSCVLAPHVGENVDSFDALDPLLEWKTAD